MGIVGIICGATALVEPRWVLDFFWGGRASPAASSALTYADGFLAGRAPWLLALVLLNVPLLLGVIVQGRWSPLSRRLQLGLALVTCAAMTWAIAGGPIFVATASDWAAKVALGLLVAFTLVDLAIKRYQRVRPMPDPLLHA
jgi:hypothetical protein